MAKRGDAARQNVMDIIARLLEKILLAFKIRKSMCGHKMA